MTKASDQNRRKPRRVGLRHQAAPTVDIDIAPDQVDDLQRELAEFPDLREIMAYNGDEDGVDGHYGPRTYRAIALIAREAGIPESQISTINFRGKSGDLYTKWQAALQNHHKENETPQQVVARIDTSAADAAAAKAIADAAAAKAAADAAAAKAAEDAKVPASIRGTEYDPRNLAKLSQQERYDLAVKGLFALDELKSERSTPNLERIHDKMDETVRWTNKHLGTTYARPAEADPLSVEALTALGQRVAAAGGIRTADTSIYKTAQTQDQLNAAAAAGLRALDRTASGRYDPTDPDNLQRLQHNIRKFEREVMGLSKVEADGIADTAMIAALEQAVRARGGLTQVTGGQSQLAGVVTAPAVYMPPAAKSTDMPTR